MKPISKRELDTHLNNLQRIFDDNLERRNGHRFFLKSAFAPNLEVFLQANSGTYDVVSDRRTNETCAVLVRKSQRLIACSFFEKWIALERKSRNEFRFDKAGITFFLANGAKDNAPSFKQIFRLEWENWDAHEKKNRAAYPHWQFDRWLTNSKVDDAQTLQELRKSLEGPAQAEALPFEPINQTVESPPQSEHRDLGWFTRIHFPTIAPWGKSPIPSPESLEDAKQKQSHRTVPETADELEKWVKSSLIYLRSEFDAHA